MVPRSRRRPPSSRPRTRRTSSRRPTTWSFTSPQNRASSGRARSFSPSFPRSSPSHGGFHAQGPQQPRSMRRRASAMPLRFWVSEACRSGAIHFVLFHGIRRARVFGLLGLAAALRAGHAHSASWHRTLYGSRRGVAVAVALLVVALVVVNLDVLVVEWAASDATERAPPRSPARIRRPTTVASHARPCTWRSSGQHVFFAKGDAFTIGYCNERRERRWRHAKHEAALHTSLATLSSERARAQGFTRSVPSRIMTSRSSER